MRGGKGVFRGWHAEIDDIFRSLRQAVNAAVYNPVVGIVNDRRAVNGFQIYFIRFSIQRNAHLVITGLDSFNIYVRPGGDDPFHRLAIDSIYYFAILIGDLKGIVDLQGSILDRWEIDFPGSANSVKTPRARKAGHIGISSVFLARQREIDVHSRHIHALGHFLFCQRHAPRLVSIVDLDLRRGQEDLRRIRLLLQACKRLAFLHQRARAVRVHAVPQASG